MSLFRACILSRAAPTIVFAPHRVLSSFLLAILLDPYCLLRLYTKHKPTVWAVSSGYGLLR